MKNFVQEFKNFILRGNATDMAVGLVIGAAFTSMVNSLVKDLLMPPIGLLLGKTDFSNLFLVLKDGQAPGPYATLKMAQDAGAVTLNAGLFLNTAISLVIVGFAVFMVVKGINKLRNDAPAPDTNRECPFCCSSVPQKASRCGFCTSELAPVE